MSAWAREVAKVAASPPAGMRLELRGDDVREVRALIEGPVGTPYAGGLFRVRLECPSDFPAEPPKAVFETRVFHPNVDRGGALCVSTLRRDWSPSLGLHHALLSIRCLLIEPNPESALDAEAAALLRDHYEQYAARARLYTELYAMRQKGDENDEAAANEQPGGSSSSSGGVGSKTGAAGGDAGAGEGPQPKRARARQADKRRILKRL